MDFATNNPKYSPSRIAKDPLSAWVFPETIEKVEDYKVRIGVFKTVSLGDNDFDKLMEGNPSDLEMSTEHQKKLWNYIVRQNMTNADELTARVRKAQYQWGFGDQSDNWGLHAVIVVHINRNLVTPSVMNFLRNEKGPKDKRKCDDWEFSDHEAIRFIRVREKTPFQAGVKSDGANLEDYWDFVLEECKSLRNFNYDVIKNGANMPITCDIFTRQSGHLLTLLDKRIVDNPTNDSINAAYVPRSRHDLIGGSDSNPNAKKGKGKQFLNSVGKFFGGCWDCCSGFLACCSNACSAPK